MVAKGDIVTVYRDGLWINIARGALLSKHPDRESAIQSGRHLARHLGVAHRIVGKAVRDDGSADGATKD